MKNGFFRTVCSVLAISLILSLAACANPQPTDQSHAPIDTPSVPGGPAIPVPTDENVDRCGFNMAYGAMATDGKYLYYRRYGGEEQDWDIQRLDLFTKEVRTLVSGSAYGPGNHCINLFLSGGKLYFTLSGGPKEELYSYDDTTGTAAKIASAKTILLAQGTLYLVDGGKLFSQPLGGGNASLLLGEEPLDLAASPECTAILTGQNRIIIIPRDGARQELDATLPEDKGKASAAYYWEKANPDNFGQLRIHAGCIYYIAHIPGADGLGEGLSMCRVNMADGNAEKLFSAGDGFDISGFTLYAGNIYYTSREIPGELNGQVTYHLYAYDLNTGENRQLAKSKAPLIGNGDTEYNAITLTGQYAFAWLLTHAANTGAGVDDTYTLYRIDTGSGAGEKMDEYTYRYFYNGPPERPMEETSGQVNWQAE